MNKRIVISLLAVTCILCTNLAFAANKPKLGVLRFTNETQSSWWGGSMATDLQDMLISELASMNSFVILERKELNAVLEEQNLAASGRAAKGSGPKMGKITGATYLVAATVSAYEESTSGGGGGLSFRGISIGGKKTETYMAVDLKLINAQTGEIADVRTIEARSDSGGLSGGISIGGVSANADGFEDTPAGKAIRGCIIEIAEYLDCSLNQGTNASCMEEYTAKDQSRRAKTKKSINLD